jgi:hypothetical protein
MVFPVAIVSPPAYCCVDFWCTFRCVSTTVRAWKQGSGFTKIRESPDRKRLSYSRTVTRSGNRLAGAYAKQRERQMLQCKDIVDLLEAYLEEELDPATTQALTAHLADCSDCTAFFNTYRRTVGTTRELREEELPAPLRERLLAFLRRETQP